MLIGAAISLGFQALREFRRADTNVEVYKSATALITTGPYRFTRNPLYICLSLAYLGAALMADSLWVLVLLIPVLLTTHYGVVLREEQYLMKKFGAAYRQYQKAVRRWL